VHEDFLGTEDTGFAADFAFVILRIRLDAIGVGAAMQAEAWIIELDLAAAYRVRDALECHGMVDFHDVSSRRTWVNRECPLGRNPEKASAQHSARLPFCERQRAEVLGQLELQQAPKLDGDVTPFFFPAGFMALGVARLIGSGPDPDGGSRRQHRKLTRHDITSAKGDAPVMTGFAGETLGEVATLLDHATLRAFVGSGSASSSSRVTSV
jgi:hypothetical protein